MEDLPRRRGSAAIPATALAAAVIFSGLAASGVTASLIIAFISTTTGMPRHAHKAHDAAARRRRQRLLGGGAGLRRVFVRAIADGQRSA